MRMKNKRKTRKVKERKMMGQTEGIERMRIKMNEEGLCRRE